MVKVTNGALSGVSALDAQGQPLAGDVTADGGIWQSSQTLVPETLYTVEVSAVGTDRQPFEQSLTVTSSAPTTVLRASLSPAQDEVVGIGMPAVADLQPAGGQGGPAGGRTTAGRDHQPAGRRGLAVDHPGPGPLAPGGLLATGHRGLGRTATSGACRSATPGAPTSAPSASASATPRSAPST